MFSFFSEFRDAQKVAGQRYHVIFFAESRYYFQYFRYLFDELVAVPGIKIAYITSDKGDSILSDNRVEAFYLKSTVPGIFPRLQADVMIMTMPDLQQYIFKRSVSVKKYVYVFHALVSTHQQYRAHAFDHYDAIFCTGPQQQAEIREAEGLYGLPAKECIPVGYPLLQDLKASTVDPQDKILIAPSWYKEGILNTCILPLVEALRDNNSEVWIRPHPEFIKRNKKLYRQLKEVVKAEQGIFFDTSPSIFTHLPDAAHLITDRSGIALEYAFANGRPVLFIDTPLKIQNPESKRFSLVPLENAFRSRLGLSVEPQTLHLLPEALRQLKSSAESYRTSIRQIENDVVYPPENRQHGVNYILKQLTL
jgi:YidC/Oxa1 family membrane protein insertase